MPELPEVETVVRDLRPLLAQRKIAAVTVSERALRRPWSAAWSTQLVGRRIQEVQRRGKWIVMALDGPLRLVWHLGMTGQLCVLPRKEPLLDHTHVVMILERGAKQLRFRDVRRFGSVTLFPDTEQLTAFFARSHLGPEPFSLAPEYWRGCLTKTQRSLKAVLLDQRVVAGVGNIYADEALFTAKLPPSQLGTKTTAVQAERLREAIVAVLNRAITFRGSSIRNYVDGAGKRGKFQETFSVYGRTEQPCRVCQTPIQRVRLAGRSTHFCPQCQKQS